MMEEESWASFYDYAPEPGTYEHAKGYDLIDPNVPLIIGDHGELFAPAKEPEVEKFDTWQGPYAPRFYEPPRVIPPAPDESQYEPWAPPIGPPPEWLQETDPRFEGYLDIPDESQYETWPGEPETAQPGPADEEMWPEWYFPDPTDPDDPRWENVPGTGQGMGRGDILPDPRGGWEEPKGPPYFIPEEIPWEGKSPDLIPGDWGGSEGIMAIVPILAVSVVMGLVTGKNGIL